MPTVQRIAPCLWFDDQAEQAATFYTSVFTNSKIVHLTRYGKAGYDIHRRPAGSVMTVEFDLDGQRFTALNGGPLFKFTEAISLQVNCETQAEIDHYWAKLTEGGDPKAQQCGWLKDKYGLSWQVVVPEMMARMMADPESPKSQRAMEVVMTMKKPIIADLERAYAG
jgi:predicted 3-demethylubiquinone-9 3-methyltransferase (glyoxalase superfamily)